MSREIVYDVAISFLAVDEALAVSLRDALQPPLEVFVYSKRQEELAGKDGTEAFRVAFREQSRLVVVLYRPPWGETPWTRVEEIAIKEMCLANGWRHLLFANLDRDSNVPVWVPEPHIYLDLTTFTLADLVGVVKARSLELGANVVPPSAAERAAAQARRHAFDAETRLLLSQSAGVFNEAVNELVRHVGEIADEVSEATGWKIQHGKGALIGGLIVTAEGQTIQVWSANLYANTAREAHLTVTEYDCEIPVQREGHVYYAPPEGLPRQREWHLEIRRLPELGWCWKLDGRVRPPRETADAIVQILLDRIDVAKNPKH